VRRRSRLPRPRTASAQRLVQRTPERIHQEQRVSVSHGGAAVSRDDAQGPGNPADMWTFRTRDGEAGFEAEGVTHEAYNQQVVGLERGTTGPKAEKVDRVKTLKGRRCLIG